MTINTQKLREAAASVRAFLKPEYGREIAAAADIIEALEGQVAEYARIAERTRAEADARIDAQTAEIAGARRAVERWKERLADAKQEVGDLKRDITDHIRIGSEQGAEIARLREALKKCAAVCAGETFHKQGLIDALEAARAALAQEGS